MTAFKKLPAVEGFDLSMDREIGVGASFGDAWFSKDDEILWQEGGNHVDKYPTVQQVEDMARADPDHDWRIAFFSPMNKTEYQRQGDGLWVLVKNGEGFA